MSKFRIKSVHITNGSEHIINGHIPACTPGCEEHRGVGFRRRVVSKALALAFIQKRGIFSKENYRKGQKVFNTTIKEDLEIFWLAAT